MKRRLSNFILILIFLIGLSLMLYPSFSNWWNSIHQTRAIASYTEQVANMDENQYEEIWNAAWEYNQSLLESPSDFVLSEEQLRNYNELLDIGDNGVMGYIEIPSIDVALPIYHGTEDAVLQIAAGHIEWTSLPVGGEGSHCVLSGHRGLPRAKLFTDLDKLVEGDTFMLRVLDEVLTYKIDQILIVEPEEIDALQIDPEMDYCTLVTCTPYGINSHRLLVRGHRIETTLEAKRARVTADAIQIEPIIVAPIVAIPVLFVLFIILMLKPMKNQKHRKAE